MIWLRVASSGAIADAASVLVNAMDQRQGSRRRNSRSNLATTWEGDRARKGSAPSLSGLHLGTTLADKFSSLHNRPTTESAGNNRDDRSLELKHAGDSTATDLKTLDFPARSEFFLATGGENSIRRGLKILRRATSVRVRVPPPAPFEIIVAEREFPARS